MLINKGKMKAEITIKLNDDNNIICFTSGARQEVIAAVIAAMSVNNDIREIILAAINRSFQLNKNFIQEVPDGSNK